MAKKNFVIRMFDNIAPTYDKLNHLLSLNIDRSWRKKAVRRLMLQKPQRVLDIACGTADFSIALAKAGVPEVIGVDISQGMLDVGRKKVEAEGLKQISLHVDDSEQLSLADDSVDAVSVAFGVRNFEHLQLGLNEMHRVIRPDGMVCVLELSVPSNAILLYCYKLYFLHILPFIGGLLSGDRPAYRYLPQSVLRFPKPEAFCAMLSQAGFRQVEATSFTFGLCRMYTGLK